MDIKHATERIFDRIYTAGEEVKNDLPNWVERVIETEAWKDARKANGDKFKTVGEWLIANYPYGPGCGQGRYAIKYDELIVLCDARKELKDTLIRYRPKGRRGGDKRSEKYKRANGTIEKRTHGTNQRRCIEERLQRDHPEIWQDYLDGKYSSARKAGIAAGFIKDSHDPAIRIRANWNKLNKKQRKEFLEWIKQN
jgi:hypothetical protein